MSFFTKIWVYFNLFKWELLMSSFYFSNMSKATINIFKYVYWCFLCFFFEARF